MPFYFRPTDPQQKDPQQKVQVLGSTCEAVRLDMCAQCAQCVEKQMRLFRDAVLRHAVLRDGVQQRNARHAVVRDAETCSRERCRDIQS